MASTIQDLFTAVRDRYQSLSSDTATVWQYGRTHLADARGAAARVVCSRAGDTYVDPLQAPRYIPGPPEERRVIATRQTEVEWHVWGPDEATVETLAANVLVVLFRELGFAVPNATPIRQEWPALDALSDLPYSILYTSVVHQVIGELIALPATDDWSLTHEGSFDGDAVC